MKIDDLKSATGKRSLAVYLVIWSAATGYLAMCGADWSFPIVSLVIFGGTLSAVGWLLTRNFNSVPVAVANPGGESKALLVYVVIYAFALIGWGLGALKAAIPAGQAQEMAVLIYKLAIHVAFPAAIILTVGGAIVPLLRNKANGARWWLALLPMATILFGLLAMVSPSLSQIGALHLSPIVSVLWVLGAWIWISIEAGLSEEFLFRACLQSRLTAWLKSPVTAIVASSLIFALVHWPGLYLRGTPDTNGFSTDPFQVAAFTIATLSPISIFFGVLWERSKSLLLIVLLHGAVDALPFAAEFVKLWG